MNQKNILAIDGFDSLQIFACHQALQMAKDGLFVTRPANIRGTALYWLAKVGQPQKPRASWKTLSEKFDYCFEAIIKDDRSEQPKTGE